MIIGCGRQLLLCELFCESHNGAVYATPAWHVPKALLDEQDASHQPHGERPRFICDVNTARQPQPERHARHDMRCIGGRNIHSYQGDLPRYRRQVDQDSLGWPGYTA